MALVLAAASGISQDKIPTVNFHYAFAPPHRITIALPDSSNKTLLDAMPGKLLMSWTYENLIYYSFNSFWTPPTKWKLVIQPQLDGHPFAQSKWERSRGYLPVLKNTYHDGSGDLALEIAGGASAAIGKTLMSKPVQVEVKFHDFTFPPAVQCPQPARQKIANNSAFHSSRIGYKSRCYGRPTARHH